MALKAWREVIEPNDDVARGQFDQYSDPQKFFLRTCKTHSLPALYHLFGGKLRAEQSSAVREI